MNSQWKPVYGFETHYMINTSGDVKSISRTKPNSRGRSHTNKSKVMTQFIDRGGYWTVKLTMNGKTGTRYLHRLLALTFKGVPAIGNIVNHKDGVKVNNQLSNLEWITRSDNQKHAIERNLCKPPHLNSKPVFNKCNGRVYPSIRAVADELGERYQDIKYMLKRKMGSCLEFAA